MDKNLIKKFAIESRNELVQKIKDKIKKYYIEETFELEQNGDIIILRNEKHILSLSKSEYSNRELLVKRIKEISLEQVIEEAAYTWFNRIIAIRYMEIHDYLPLTKDNQSLGVRVLSSKDNTPDPEIMKISNLINPDLDIEFNKEYYGTIQDNNKRFEYVLLLVCKKIGNVIPQIFDGITDYIDILIPDNLLNESGYVNKLLKDLDESYFNQVEIIGWLYQYYNQEQKDLAMSSTSSKKVYSKNEVPFVTQLFTPDWIVKYMVENTLGKYWIEHGGEKSLIDKWKYYVTSSESQNKPRINPEDIKCIDPCSGSGHILVYIFEVLYQIYCSTGYSTKDIPELILRKNIYGLDVDDRASQLSLLSLLLKAREYDNAIFNKKIVQNLNVVSIQESNSINVNDIDMLISTDEDKNNILNILELFNNAKDIGSILNISDIDIKEFINKYEELKNKDLNIFEYEKLKVISNKFYPLLKVISILTNQYDVVVTNPPYLSLSVMNNVLKKYVNKYYNDYKYDLFSVFTQKCYDLLINNGYYAMITPPSILFLDTFEKTRKNIIDNSTIDSLLHMGRGVFGIDFGSCSFVIKKELRAEYKTKFFKLHKRTFQYINLSDIEKIFLSSLKDYAFRYNFEKYNNSFLDGIDNIGDLIVYEKNQNIFNKLPSLTFSYWLSERIIDLFNNKNVNDYSDVKQGMTTGNNNIFLRYWYEVNINKVGFGLDNKTALESNYKWFPYNKGGDFRKWYGNNEYVVNYENNGAEVKEYTSHLPQGTAVRIKSYDYYFRESGTWSFISSNNFGIRYSPQGAIFDVAGSSLFSDRYLYYLIGLLSTNMVNELLKSLNPTVNFQTKNIKSIPVILDEKKEKEITDLVKENIKLSKLDWDSYETSWDFDKSPLVKLIDEKNSLLKDIYINWCKEIDDRFNQLKENEKELNKIFLNIYNLNNEISSDINEETITIRKSNISADIKEFISYAVGCMFGRYSIDTNGLAYAGGDFNKNKYKSFEADVDNIIPLTEDNYFGDDIVIRFKKFIESVYGANTLYKNLDFIADALGKKNGENAEETLRRYFINDFYNDHVKMYQKRPIYWLFDSGKKNGFKCLIYMHRYEETLVAKIRLNYLHRIQNSYEKELKEITDKLNNDVDLTSKRELSKRQADLSSKLQETNEYDEKIAHIAEQKIKIDLDDGVVVNYAKFSVKNPKTGKDESILAKIK